MSDLSHLNQDGEAHMVDVGGKEVTRREAVAEAVIRMAPDTVTAVEKGATVKGDVRAVARVAGIMAAKRTAELIPLCHPLALSSVEIDIDPTGHGLRVVATVRTDGKTGVEMEAMTAVSVAALAVYDMVKGIERGVTVESIRLLKKTGGKSGEWVR